MSLLRKLNLANGNPDAVMELSLQVTAVPVSLFAAGTGVLLLLRRSRRAIGMKSGALARAI